MKDRRQDIASELKRAGKDTVAFFRSLSPEQLDAPVYSEEVQWSARRVLAHLVSIEKTMHWLFRNILEGGPGSPEDFDVERFNRTQPQKFDSLSMEELLERFEAVRSETVRIVETMAEADMDRQGRHVFLGPGRLETFIRWAYRHARLHEKDVRRALSIP